MLLPGFVEMDRSIDKVGQYIRVSSYVFEAGGVQAGCSYGTRYCTHNLVLEESPYVATTYLERVGYLIFQDFEEGLRELLLLQDAQ